ncbi:MAG: hypothetical protein EHM13_02915 [Acidobacteria bacterium]|nr:MAG: hypothetical protein EHM13_02915 [Acidobacteriota bacterium]
MRNHGRALFAFGALVLTAFLIHPSAQQQQPQQQQQQPPKKTKEQEKLEKTLQAEIQALVQVVDQVAAGQQAAPADLPITFENHYLKARDERTFSPFVITVPSETIQAQTVLLYFRLVKKDGAPPAEAAAQKPEGQKDQQAQPKQYAFEDVHGITVPPAKPAQPHRFMRAFAVAGGEYEMLLALRERLPQGKKPDPKAPPKTTVVRKPITVPDYWNGALATSSVILADSVEQLEAAPTEQQMVTHPYIFGMTRLTPAVDNVFTKAENVSMLFLVYNTQLDEAKKPDVQVDYNFHQVLDSGEKFFNRTEPQVFNAKTLPPQFDPSVGHQIVGGQEIPLASFPEGKYRLEIKVTDKLAKQTVVANIPFAVQPG